MLQRDAPHHRRSIRLQHYDYSRAGAYFVTICVHARECLLGDVSNDEMRLNETGQIAQDIWLTLPTRYPETELDAFVVMSNHVHGIIVIGDVGAIHVGAIHELPLRGVVGGGAIHESPLPPVERRKMLLPKVIGYFKMNAAKRANDLRSARGVPFWQRNYYEHIIRNERELHAVRQYIANNPLKWALDHDNPRTWKGSAPSQSAAAYMRDAAMGRGDG